METVGHIKIGGTTRGLPVQSSKIKVTTTGKLGEENFAPSPGFDPEGYHKLQVKVPFIKEVDRNFKVGEISFVVVNGIYKYRAEIEKASVVLYPYQPYFEDPLKQLPVIKLGGVKKWRDNLDLKTRAIAYFLINGDLYDFKTASAFTIQEMQRAFNILSTFEPSDVARANLNLLYKSKLFKAGETEEVKYLTISEINQDSFLVDQEIPSSIIDALVKIEESQSREDCRTPVTLKAAEEFFGKKITVELDYSYNSEFEAAAYVSGASNSAPSKDLVEKADHIEEKKEILKEKVQKKKEKVSDNSDILEKLENDAGVPKPIAIGLVSVYGADAYARAEAAKFHLPDLVCLVTSAPKS